MPRQTTYKRPKDTKKTIRKLLRYMGRHRLALVLVAALVLASSLANIMGTYLLKPVINDFILPGDLTGLLGAVLGMGTVAYQGVEGAFSHIALTRLFQHVRAQA